MSIVQFKKIISGYMDLKNHLEKNFDYKTILAQLLSASTYSIFDFQENSSYFYAMKNWLDANKFYKLKNTYEQYFIIKNEYQSFSEKGAPKEVLNILTPLYNQQKQILTKQFELSFIYINGTSFVNMLIN